MADVTVTSHRVSKQGQITLPAEALRRWSLTEGGAVDVVDLGDALVVVPAGRGGLPALVGAAVDDAGGYRNVVESAVNGEPDLA